MPNEKHLSCIDKVRREIKSAMPSVSMVMFKCVGVNGVTGQQVEFCEAIEKKDGSIVTVKRKSFVTHNYCPFCGEEYE